MTFHGPQFVLAIIALSFVGWIVTTWIRARHGYPITDDIGRTVGREDAEAARAQFSTEIAGLAAELRTVKERLATVETIVTDDARHLTHDIEALR